MGLFGKKPLVTDPVCGMQIRPAQAAGSALHEGQTYHFCSDSCKAKFEADPGHYISRMP